MNFYSTEELMQAFSPEKYVEKNASCKPLAQTMRNMAFLQSAAQYSTERKQHSNICYGWI